MGRSTAISPTEVRILSELARLRRGTSPNDLARRAGLSRSTLYVLVGRLAKRRCITRRPDQVRGSAEYRVLYEINDKGRKARAAFAQKVGLKP